MSAVQPEPPGTSLSAETATLRFEAARFEVRGEVYEWEFESNEERVGLVDDGGALAGLLLADGTVLSGRAAVCGQAPVLALRSGVVGIARCQEPLPSGYSVRDLLTLAGKLAGTPRASARAAADAVLVELGLDALAARRTEVLSQAERRWVHLACAVLRRPLCVVADRPLDGLDEPYAAGVRTVLERACHGRRLVFVTAQPDWDGRSAGLVRSAQRLIRFERGLVVRNGTPEDVIGAPALYSVLVAEHAAEFVAALQARGVRIVASTAAASVPGVAARLLIEAPASGHLGLVVDAALDAAAPVVRLVGVDRDGVGESEPERSS